MWQGDKQVTMIDMCIFKLLQKKKNDHKKKKIELTSVTHPQVKGSFRRIYSQENLGPNMDKPLTSSRRVSSFENRNNRPEN